MNEGLQSLSDSIRDAVEAIKIYAQSAECNSKAGCTYLWIEEFPNREFAEFATFRKIVDL
ncbi:14583_t:CDS:2 [Gigaspora margarita]|uniref:14583_t:CDS:1 n=1 Tax=Gigaspora margarita TaxID=4874 RepID=A0ABN7URW1_GIGMA|nr:14583_t:CDS:2 [Gigaspora margarita]